VRRAALVLLADALARQDAAEVLGSIRSGEVISDLTHVLERRHPEFHAALDPLSNQISKSANSPA